ncbi:MAG TPA: class I SAM-dependent methyltransferase [Terracidiphilus sp.]|nr:class I SAM-dependent methyltransferase [Terracidiphilus sp.]
MEGMKLTDSYNQRANEWVDRIRSGKNFAHTYLEKPAMYRKLPNLRNKAVLCIGCGSAEECMHLLDLGAKRVVGIDVSRELIAIARSSYPEAEFHVMDMRKLNFPGNSFDFVYSSLAMHYLKDWRPTLRGIRNVLKPNGRFLFSTHHPAYWSGEIIQSGNKKSRLLGYAKTGDRLKKVWGDYQHSRRINDVWFGNMEVSYYHHPLSKILKEIRDSGFEVVDLIEPKPLASLKKVAEDDYALYNRIPLFMVFELRKASRFAQSNPRVPRVPDLR